MPKCDTPDTSKDLLNDDGTRGGWCRRCYGDLLRSDDEDQSGIRCEQCKVIHLKQRTYEKIVGWLCRSCAKVYDEELLKQMASVS